MPRSLPDRLGDVHPQMLRVEGESDRKKVVDLRPVVGSLLERTFELMGLTQKAVSYELGYADQGTVSRWCSGLERPQFDKLIAIDGFIEAWVIALSEKRPRTIRVETILTIQRRA